MHVLDGQKSFPLRAVSQSVYYIPYRYNRHSIDKCILMIVSTGERPRTLAICRLEISLTKLPLVSILECHTQKILADDHWPSMREALGDCTTLLSVTVYN